MKLFLASSNAHKLEECKQIFTSSGIDLEISHPDQLSSQLDIIEDAWNFEGNAIKKALAYWKFFSPNIHCLSDDSGLVVPALDGAPGVRSARFAGDLADDDQNNQALIHALQKKGLSQTQAYYQCCMVWVSQDAKVLCCTEKCHGIIQTQATGDGGFGYDPHFYLPELGKTMAQLSPEEKNRISHRGKALRLMVKKITQFL